MDDSSEDLKITTLAENLVSKIFYSSASISSIDDEIILGYIFKRFPDFRLPADLKITKELEKNLRLKLIDIMSDKEFIFDLMDRHEIGIQDIFRVICKYYSFIFNSIIYIKKLQKIIEDNGYL